MNADSLAALLFLGLWMGWFGWVGGPSLLVELFRGLWRRRDD